MQAVQPAYVGCMVYKRGLYSLHTWAINLSPLKLDYQATIIGFIQVHCNKNKLSYAYRTFIRLFCWW